MRSVILSIQTNVLGGNDMNLSDFKFYSLLFVALLVIGYVYLEQAGNRENAYSEVINEEEHRLAIEESEQESNESTANVENVEDYLDENMTAAGGVLQLVSFKE